VRSPDTVLIIPAAGAGTRLQSPTPKVLAPVNGRPMIDHLFELYRRAVTRVVLVLHPAFEPMVREHCEATAVDLHVTYARQPEPTGMLDAILLAASEVRAAGAGRIWITWCDQIGVHPNTIATLLRLSSERPEAPLIFPTARQETPYIHLERDASGRITAIHQRREGDQMPPAGESDMGLFSLSPDAYFNWLPRFGAEAADAARERNFLPFVPWLEQRGQHVVTFPCTDEMEAIGINTPDDRRRLEQYLLERDRA
jgi:bifunctional UDP-N-acetylglucosamine pyrophosphorylase/glucosamine-1-phosphate N-acetyltransferase